MERRKKIIKIFLAVILFAVAIYSGMEIFKYFYAGYAYEKINESIREEYYDSESSTIKEGLEQHLSGIDRKEDKSNKFKRLWDINSDIVGWVRVPGTKIDYPVVKDKNNDYYLRRNINKEWALRGTIFMDYRSHENAEDLNTVIYGHNMKDGSMFGNLSKYKNKDFFVENQYVEYDYPGATTKWQIFSVCVYKSEDDFFKVTFNNQKEYEIFIADCKKRSIYDTDILIEENDRILTLMTCTYETDDARLAVYAKLVK